MSSVAKEPFVVHLSQSGVVPLLDKASRALTEALRDSSTTHIDVAAVARSTLETSVVVDDQPDYV
jgi:hypothetical protein